MMQEQDNNHHENLKISTDLQHHGEDEESDSDDKLLRSQSNANLSIIVFVIEN
jgi:hypothetical protein